MSLNRIALFGVLTVIILSLSSTAYAHPHVGQVLINEHSHQPQTEVIPLGTIMGIEKTTILFHASEYNKLPWGFVEGKIANHVEGYPVIIQIYKDNEAVHFAQTDVDKDGIYEHKFRVQSLDNGYATKFFEGEYLVKIFKIVYLDQKNLI